MTGNDIKRLMSKNMLANGTEIPMVNTVNNFLVGKGFGAYLPVAKKQWKAHLENLAIAFHKTAQDIHKEIKNNKVSSK